MNTLIYKRTHTGDPNEKRVFGCEDCMRSVRRRSFDAVIGVGGKSPWPDDKDIARKINWVGIKAHRTEKPSLKGPLVTFECFRIWDEKGPYLKTLAPNLFRYMFEDQHVRVVMSRSLSSKMQKEVTKLLRWAKKHRSAKPRVFGKKTLSKHKC